MPLSIFGSMEYEYQSGYPVKKLTQSDVSERLAVPKAIAAVMPPAEPERDIPIRVLDDLGHVYQFRLSRRRRGPHTKPVFQSREWGDFVKYRGAKVGDLIHFWPEVNEDAGTHYRIVLFRNYLGSSST